MVPVWIRRGTLVLGSLLFLLGVDSALHWYWYHTEYSDGMAFDPGGDASTRKDFVRLMPHEVMHFIYVPEVRIKTRARNWWSGEYVPYIIKTNSFGLRNPEVKLAKAPGTLRVVAMGGSSTAGTGVRLDQTYIYQLVRLLRYKMPGRKIEAINAGVDAYRSYNVAALYQQVVWSLKPDLVVVALDVNERGPKNIGVEEMAAWSPPPRDQWPTAAEDLDADFQLGGPRAPLQPMSRLAPALHRSGLYMSLTYLLQVILRPEPAEGIPRDTSEEGIPPPLGNPRCPARRKLGALTTPWSDNMARYRQNMGFIDQMLREDGVPTIYLSVPVADDLRLDLNNAYPFADVMARLAAGRPNAEHVTALKSFCRHGMGEVMIDDVHPSVLGQSLLARAMAPVAAKMLGQTTR